MSWPGWEHFVPGGVALKAKLSRGDRMHAKPAIVDAQMNVIEKIQADAFGVKGEYFHSKKEAGRWVLLSQYQTRGLIGGLRRQVRIPLSTRSPGGERVVIGVYVADFMYTDSGKQVVEDVKGMMRREDLYLWKKRHVKAEYGWSILEV
jgi:hypothetical protein